MGPVVRCGPSEDPDGDGISNRWEGPGDADHDGVINANDPDSDNDGIPDAFEANYGAPRSCDDPPVDSDRDGAYDFQDTDSNNDMLSDTAQAAPNPLQAGAGSPPAADCLQGGGRGVQTSVVSGWTCHPFDTDTDGRPDYADADADGDRIENGQEIAPGGAAAPTDTDGDGLPDWRDTDSDGDTILDVHETGIDRDLDGTPNFRDLDSDGDNPTGSEANSDRNEAGDADPATPPVQCPRELNVATLNLMDVMPDGVPDFEDTDSDNDGLSDREEAILGTDRCNPDSDGDGQLDSAEAAYCRNRMRTGCATERSQRIPDTDYYLILPFGGSAVNRELEFGTNIHVADVFFISDTTGSMGGQLRAVQSSIATPRTGLIDSLLRVIPDTWFGVSHYDDFPFGGYGSSPDRAFWPLCAGVPTSTPGCQPDWGITVQPPMRAMDVQATANQIRLHGGSDGPESAVEALYQIITGEGFYDRSRPDTCRGSDGRGPCWVPPRNCVDGTRGMPCFRAGALPIVVHYTDAPFHNGARNESPPGSTYNEPYVGISPTPHNMDDLINAYNRNSGRVVNMNANSGQRCAGMRPTSHSGFSPCFDFRVLAEGTSSVDLEGNPLVFDLPGGGTVSSDFVDTVVEAVNTLATRVPIDINTATRNDPANPAMVDATRFIRRRTPSCQIAPMNDRCWTEPMGVTHRAAVARTDLSTFYRVVPGTRVRFTIFFQNDNVFRGERQSSTLFRAFIDVVGDGVTTLDTREVYILVPASDNGPG
jgi:hypothetical protein